MKIKILLFCLNVKNLEHDSKLCSEQYWARQILTDHRMSSDKNKSQISIQLRLMKDWSLSAVLSEFVS